MNISYGWKAKGRHNSVCTLLIDEHVELSEFLLQPHDPTGLVANDLISLFNLPINELRLRTSEN